MKWLTKRKALAVSGIASLGVLADVLQVGDGLRLVLRLLGVL